MKAPKTLKQGFTLVEVLVVVAIISLLAAIMIPAFQAAKKKRDAQLLGNRPMQSTQVEQSNNSVTINGETYYKEKIIPDTITLDGIEYKRVR